MLLGICTLTIGLRGQGLPPVTRLAPDQPGCVDSQFLPKLLGCRIDHCEKKDADRRDIAVAENDDGDPRMVTLDVNSRSLMYECPEGATPASIAAQAAVDLKAAKFDITYRFAEVESSVTARKDDFWITVEAASRYYTLTEMATILPDFDDVNDADSIAEMLDRFGHVPLYEVQFGASHADLSPSSARILREVAAMLKDHPLWRIRVDGHTDNIGPKPANLALSLRRAEVVTSFLTANGVKRTRFDPPQGLGDAHPYADNATEAGRTKNRRIEIVKVASLAAPEQ
jgi:outer membrane protein OmpA-like peptidoglycan-associated protein